MCLYSMFFVGFCLCDYAYGSLHIFWYFCNVLVLLLFYRLSRWVGFLLGGFDGLFGVFGNFYCFYIVFQFVVFW